MPTSFPISLPWAPTGFVTQSDLDTKFTSPINDLAATVADSGWLTTGISASGSGSSVSGLALRSFGPIAAIRANVVIGTAITVLSNGDTANTTVAQVTNSAFVPAQGCAFAAYASGPVVIFTLTTSGLIQICAVGNSSISLASGVTVSFYGTYLL